MPFMSSMAGTLGYGRSATSAGAQQGIVTNGLLLYLDAGNPASYPGSGTTWTDLSSNANSATSLRSATNFKLEGDVQSNVVSFNGTGNLNKVFTTQLTADIISNKPSIGTSKDSDEILVYRSSTGLRKTTRAVFFDDLSVPIGTILPYAGQ